MPLHDLGHRAAPESGDVVEVGAVIDRRDLHQGALRRRGAGRPVRLPVDHPRGHRRRLDHAVQQHAPSGRHHLAGRQVRAGPQHQRESGVRVVDLDEEGVPADRY